MRAKLSFVFSGLILGMTVFFYVFAVFQTTREIKISAIYKGHAVAEALKGEVVYALQSKNFPNLDFTFHRLASSKNDIAYVILLDPRGVILSGSEPEQAGQTLADSITRQSLSSAGARVQFKRRDIEGQGFSELCDVSVPIISRGKRVATLRVGISLTQYLLANAPRIRWTIALFALPFAFLSILIAMKLSQSITHPLRALTQAVSEVGQGNYSVQLPLSRHDEIGEVAQIFNKMALNLKENFSKVSDMANRDGLTGLYNARFFQEALAHELERVKRNGQPLSLIILDADRFKRVNDRYGHPVGDQILQHVSRMVRSVLRGYDVLARYGGEEFIALLTDTAAPQALILAQRLRKTVEQHPYALKEGGVIKVTISIGVAQSRPPHERKEVISQADQALYRAKETGRNKVVLFKSTDAAELPDQKSSPAPAAPTTPTFL